MYFIYLFIYLYLYLYFIHIYGLHENGCTDDNRHVNFLSVVDHMYVLFCIKFFSVDIWIFSMSLKMFQKASCLCIAQYFTTWACHNMEAFSCHWTIQQGVDFKSMGCNVCLLLTPPESRMTTCSSLSFYLLTLGIFNGVRSLPSVSEWELRIGEAWRTRGSSPKLFLISPLCDHF